MRLLTAALASALAFAPASLAQSGEAQWLEDLRILSADEMQGREVGTEGAARARAYIAERFEEIGVAPIGESWEHSFVITEGDAKSDGLNGVNMIARIEGAGDSDRVMVVSAHYDHEGMRHGEIWNGADDNASGVAGLFAIAESFIAHPPEHDVIFAALDAEESGLRGARAFVADPPVPAETIAFNLNLDMIAYSEEDLLWAVGTYHYPSLTPIVERVAETAPVGLPMGFDQPTDEPGGDWTMLTDSGAFHAAGIPFIYLGVDFHPHYHQPTDTYENMTLDFFVGAVETVVAFAREADAALDMIGEAEGR